MDHNWTPAEWSETRLFQVAFPPNSNANLLVASASVSQSPLEISELSPWVEVSRDGDSEIRSQGSTESRNLDDHESMEEMSRGYTLFLDRGLTE